MRPLAIALGFALVSSAVLSAPGEAAKSAPCYLTVTVPVGATLTVNGARTEQMTAVRRFVSPALPAGKKFYYTFEATYTSSATPVARKQTVEVSAGADLAVDLLTAPLVSVDKPSVTPKPSPFDKPKSKSK